MIRPLRNFELSGTYPPRGFSGSDLRPFPILDRAFDAVETALRDLGIDDPASLRTPRPVEDALSDTALPDGTLLILSPSELRAAEVDVEETVKDERQGGSVFVSLPQPADLPGRARGLRELASAAETFGFYQGSRPSVPSRLGKVKQLSTPLELQGYRFLMADTPGFRVAVISRVLPGGGFVGLWTGNENVLKELRLLFKRHALAAGHRVPPASQPVPELDGIASEDDVWDQAKDLRAYRVVREAELREIARAAALRGVALRREREAAKRAAASG